MSEIAMIAKLTAVEGKLDEVVAIMTPMVEAVKSEPGTLVYAMHVSTEQSAIYFYERYTDQAALAAHGSSDAMKAVGPKLKGLTAGRPEITMLTPVAAKGV